MKKFLSFIVGLAGLSFVIVIHELGHLLAAKYFDVAAPVFSIGFGPRLFGIQIGTTLYQLAALPLGGYVQLNQAQLHAQSYSAQMIIIMAGIAINILFAYGIFALCAWRGIPYKQMLRSVMDKKGRGFMGPIAIIGLIQYSATLGGTYFLIVIAMLSFSIGMFNLLPLPFLDGGQMVGFTYQALQRIQSPDSYGNPLLWMLLIIATLCMVLRGALKRSN